MGLRDVAGCALRAVASDLTPLRESAAFRRLFAGQAVSLAYGSTQLAIIVGPLLAGVAVAAGGFGSAYRSMSGPSPPSSTPLPGCRRCRLGRVPDGPGSPPLLRGCGSSRAAQWC